MPTILPERQEEPKKHIAVEITKIIVEGIVFCFLAYLIAKGFHVL